MNKDSNVTLERRETTIDIKTNIKKLKYEKMGILGRSAKKKGLSDEG